MTSMAKYMAVRARVSALQRQIDTLKEKVTELMAHPDATADDVMQARQCIQNVQKRIDEANAKIDVVANTEPEHGFRRHLKLQLVKR